VNLVITGVGVVSAAGQGLEPLLRLLDAGGDAFCDVPPYEPEGLSRPRCASLPGLDRDRPAETLLLAAAGQALTQAGLPQPPSSAGLVIGTSSGNISGPWERWHRAVLAGRAANEAGCGRDAPTLKLRDAYGLLGPCTTMSVACASGTAAFATAAGWLEEELAPMVLVGGVDALSLYIHAGFNGLGALSLDGARPFHPERDGLTLGEGAAVLVLEPAGAAAARGVTPLATLLGAGLAADATHISAPHREGRGAAAAMQAALHDGGLAAESVDMVSLHGTGTVFNDAMEAWALRRVFGDRPVAFHGIKHAIGHTLGAAGAVEAAVLVGALQRGEQPPPPPTLDPGPPFLPPPVPGPRPTVALSTSSAFGGSNAALVLGLPGGVVSPERAPAQVRVVARASVELAPGKVDWAALWPDAPERFRRLNRYVRTGMVALQRLFDQLPEPPPSDTGLVLASPGNCRGVDLRYHQRLVRRGAAQASRLDFVYTVPGAPVAEATIHWDLRGPPVVLVGPMAQAEDEAARMIRRGRAARLVALGLDAPAQDQPAVATACLLERA
jgi:3-oxoacyl-[acyl-carrier-protein] synthase II